MRNAESNLHLVQRQPLIDPVRERFLTRWGKLPERQPWSAALAQWQSKRLWREDVHFDKVCAYLRYADTQAVKIKTYCERSEQDLLDEMQRVLIESFQKQLLLGHWIDPKPLGNLPNLPGDQVRQVDFTYTGNEQHRVWQAWIATYAGNPVIELQIKYPKGEFGSNEQRSYMFRVAIRPGNNEADRLEDTLSGELSAQEKQAMTPVHTAPMKLAIPGAIKP